MDITSTCTSNTSVAIAEEDVFTAVLPTLAPIVHGASATVVAIEGGPDLTTVDGIGHCRGRFGTNSIATIKTFPTRQRWLNGSIGMHGYFHT